MEKIKVMMCDDAEYLCIGFESKLRYVDDIKSVGCVTDAKECVDSVGRIKPDILLLDIQMKTRTEGIDIIPQLLEAHPPLKIIMLSSYDDDNYVFSAFVNGATDYVTKDIETPALLEKIRNVYTNNYTLQPKIAQKLTRESRKADKSQRSLLSSVNTLLKLTTSEIELLKLLYEGHNYAQIAKARFVGETTVRTLASRVLRKFGTTSMKQLVSDLKEIQIFELLDRD